MSGGNPIDRAGPDPWKEKARREQEKSMPALILSASPPALRRIPPFRPEILRTLGGIR